MTNEVNEIEKQIMKMQQQKRTLKLEQEFENIDEASTEILARKKPAGTCSIKTNTRNLLKTSSNHQSYTAACSN